MRLIACEEAREDLVLRDVAHAVDLGPLPQGALAGTLGPPNMRDQFGIGGRTLGSNAHTDEVLELVTSRGAHADGSSCPSLMGRAEQRLAAIPRQRRLQFLEG